MGHGRHSSKFCLFSGAAVPTGAVELKDAKDQAERRGLRH